MQRPLAVFLSLAVVFMLAGCLTSRVERSGGPGSITVPNTNPDAIRLAAQAVFPRYGYSAARSDFPRSLSFDRPAGRFGEWMFGGFNQTTSFRVRMQIVPIPGTHDIRLMTQVSRVNNANRAGFERENQMLRSWASQFQSILRDIKAKAANAGPNG